MASIRSNFLPNFSASLDIQFALEICVSSLEYIQVRSWSSVDEPGDTLHTDTNIDNCDI